MHRPSRTLLPAALAAVALAGLGACKKTPPPAPPAVTMETLPSGTVDFGSVPLKADVKRLVHVTNTGTKRFLVTKATVDDKAAFLPHLPTELADLDVGDSVDVEVVFSSQSEGPHEATLTIETDAPELKPVTLPLKANSVPAEFCGPCATPPRDACLSQEALLLHERVGACEEGQCRFERRVLSCAGGCDFIHLTCNDVACPAGAPATVTAGNAGATEVAAATTRWGYGLAWSAPKDGKRALTFALWGADRVKRSDPVPQKQITGEAWSPALAFSGNEFGLAYVGNEDGDEEIYVTGFSEHADSPHEPVRITDAAGSAASPALAMGDGARSEFGLAWADGRASKPGIYFTRVSSVDGTKLGAEVELADLPVEAHATAPAVLWTGTAWLVVWSDNRDGSGSELYARQVSIGGDAVGVPVRVTDAAGESTDPTLVLDGTRVLVAWSDARSGTASLFLRSLGLDGAPQDDEQDLALTPGNVRSPRFSMGGGQQAFAWIDDRLDAGGPGLYAAVRSEESPQLKPTRVSRVDALSSPALVPTFGQFGLAFVGIQEPREKADAFFQPICAPAAPLPETPDAGTSDEPDAGSP